MGEDDFRNRVTASRRLRGVNVIHYVLTTTCENALTDNSGFIFDSLHNFHIFPFTHDTKHVLSFATLYNYHDNWL